MRKAMHHLYHISVFGFVLFFLVSSATSHSASNKTMVNSIKCIEIERNALLDIKQGLVVDLHGRLLQWGSSTQGAEDCCQWSGVGCDHHTGHVIQLNLSGFIPFNITNPLYVSPSNISSSLLRLRYLKYLDLSGNQFSVPLPSFIGSLRNLIYLDLSHANFEGAPLDELGNLSKLAYLNLSYTTFYPPTNFSFIGSLTNLIHLDLSSSSYGFEGPIPFELRNLSKLDYLDLSSNWYSDNPIPKFIASSTSLTYLDLSDNQFSGAIPHELGNLSELHHLDLSHNNLDGDSFVRLFHLPSLTYLDLSVSSAVDLGTLNAYNWVSFIYMIPTLSVLRLINCNLSSIQPPSYSLSNSSAPISILHLPFNSFDSSIFDWISNLSTSLVDLDLSFNSLQGRIPISFGVMSSITHLDLTMNKLEGFLPNSFHNLSSLQVVHFSENKLTENLLDILNLLPEATLQILHISSNQISGSLPDISKFSLLEDLDVASNRLNGYLPIKFEHKSVLKHLDLSFNYLQGSLPNFSRFTFLKDLNLNDNKFSGSLPDFTGCSSLESLTLQQNQLSRWETQSIGQLTNLYNLDLSRNSISSTINEHHLSKLFSLQRMDASFNSLTFNMSSDWHSPFKLQELSLASCKLGPKFPTWIKNQKGILVLDFSNTQISDIIPMWLMDISVLMTKLDLSFNKIRGTFSSIYLNLEEINLSFNYLEGPLPLIPRGCMKINLSHNKFSGKLLSTYEDTTCSFLDLSHNLLFGEFPDKWIHFENLVFLNLGNNNFLGRIPMSIGYLTSLQTLILRNNFLNGELPKSLRNCTKLGFVDFGLNSLSGTLPEWIGQDLPQLYALVLKSNKFYGSLPYNLCHLSDLRFLDLSMNRISGNVPQCFGNLTAMIENVTGLTDHYYVGYGLAVKAANYYLDDALAGWKGKEREYGSNFAYLKMIDLSNNELTGELPIGVTRLLNLNGLNLSRNRFVGKVPVQIGRLLKLENLDLSSNKFTGEIPQSLSRLTFLSYMDLSNNNLSGRIPLGSQLQTFNSSAYVGNPGLCGFPLKKRCPGDETSVALQPSPTGNKVDEDEIVYKRWLYISVALGFSTGFWGICVTLLLNRRLRHAYFLLLTTLKDQLYVFMAVCFARLKERLQG